MYSYYGMYNHSVRLYAYTRRRSLTARTPEAIALTYMTQFLQPVIRAGLLASWRSFQHQLLRSRLMVVFI